MREGSDLRTGVNKEDFIGRRFYRQEHVCSITGEKKWVTQEKGNDKPGVEVRGDAAGTGQEQTLQASWLQGHKACRQFHVLICKKINKR